MAYIRQISPEGSKYGIVKVVPPDSWNPEFAMDTEVGIMFGIEVECAMFV